MKDKKLTETIKAHISAGNTKLPASIAIFNLGSASSCPSNKLGLCPLGKAGLCYAFKAERQFPNCRPYRDRQAVIWQSVTPEQFASAFIAINARKLNKFKELRFNESGDFWTQACVNKADQIASLLKPHGITVYTYTHRKDLDFSGISDLIVNGSNFMVHNEFRAVKNLSGKPENRVCPMDCGKCAVLNSGQSLCSKKSGIVIECKIH